MNTWFHDLLQQFHFIFTTSKPSAKVDEIDDCTSSKWRGLKCLSNTHFVLLHSLTICAALVSIQLNCRQSGLHCLLEASLLQALGSLCCPGKQTRDPINIQSLNVSSCHNCLLRPSKWDTCNKVVTIFVWHFDHIKSKHQQSGIQISKATSITMLYIKHF